MKYQQRDIVEVNFLFPDGTFKPHPALIVSNNELQEEEGFIYLCMISSKSYNPQYNNTSATHGNPCAAELRLKGDRHESSGAACARPGVLTEIKKVLFRALFFSNLFLFKFYTRFGRSIGVRCTYRRRTGVRRTGAHRTGTRGSCYYSLFFLIYRILRICVKQTVDGSSGE